MLQIPQPISSKILGDPASPLPPQPPVSNNIMHPASIKRLIGLALDLPPNSTLGIVWQHAFEEGKRVGHAEGAKLVDGIDIDEVLKTGVERGIEIGRDQEKCAWVQQATATSVSRWLAHLEVLLSKLKTPCLLLSQLQLSRLKHWSYCQQYPTCLWVQPPL